MDRNAANFMHNRLRIAASIPVPEREMTRDHGTGRNAKVRKRQAPNPPGGGREAAAQNSAAGHPQAAQREALPAGLHLLIPPIRSHRLVGASSCPSPHHDARPDPADISLLVIHAISLPPGEFGAAANRGFIHDLFCGRLDPRAHPYFAGITDLRVSPHLAIFRDGSATQYVAFDRRAWHAGESAFDGRERCNDFSIGIELEGDDAHPFADAQYSSLARIGAAILGAYPKISLSRVVGHADIAPHRKTDPGPHFDWPRFLTQLEFPR